MEELEYNPQCEALKANGEQCTKHAYCPGVYEGHRYTTCRTKEHKDFKFGAITLPPEELAKRKIGPLTSAWLGEDAANEPELHDQYDFLLDEEYEDPFCRDHITEQFEDLTGDPGGCPDDEESEVTLNFERWTKNGFISVGKKRATVEGKPEIKKTPSGFSIEGMRFNSMHTHACPTKVFGRYNTGELKAWSIVAKDGEYNLVDSTAEYEAAKAAGKISWAGKR